MLYAGVIIVDCVVFLLYAGVFTVDCVVFMLYARVITGVIIADGDIVAVCWNYYC